jgi:hypothetical protein
MSVVVVACVCFVFFLEMRVYIKVRQDYLTSADHRLKPSATMVLVSSIPGKWLTEEGLRNLFRVCPGGVRRVWINRDLSSLLRKISHRVAVHRRLEAAETDLIRAVHRAKYQQDKTAEPVRSENSRLGNYRFSTRCLCTFVAMVILFQYNTIYW